MTEQGVLDGIIPPARSPEEVVAEAHGIIAAAREEHRPARTFVLFSGGNDSLVLLDAVAAVADEVVHVNTGIGIPETTEFAHDVGSSYGLPFTEMHPPESYESLVLGRWDGLPGPGAHRFAYVMLKERCIAALLRQHRTRRGERFMLLTGARSAESVRRMGTSEVVRRDGGQVWVNPLQYVTNEEMSRYRVERRLPVNEVAANLHMSGECLCGAMASQGPEREERALIRFFYPEFDARLSDLERQCREAGKTYCEWGVKRATETRGGLPMCQSCEFRFDPTPTV
jgi:3'-phosphoadenosine 5'-phosphosulfate sulfotransferase (PAPS reductase)/FAD synthetase